MSILTRIPAGARPVVWGLLIGVSGLGLLAVLIVLQTAFSYDGDCGGLLPFMGGGSECGIWEYLRVWLPFNFEVIVYSYWYFLVAIIAAPIIILESYYLYLKGRRGRRS